MITVVITERADGKMDLRIEPPLISALEYTKEQLTAAYLCYCAEKMTVNLVGSCRLGTEPPTQ